MHNFFQQLAELATEKLTLGMSVTVDKDDCILTVVPKTGQNWKPWTVRGKPAELDAAMENKLQELAAGIAVIKESASYADEVKKQAEPAKTAAPAATKKEEPKKPAPAPTKSAKPATKKPVPPEKKIVTTSTTTVPPTALADEQKVEVEAETKDEGDQVPPVGADWAKDNVGVHFQPEPDRPQPEEIPTEPVPELQETPADDVPDGELSLF